ncbi:MAG: PKD domain-containing protein [Desulfococcaceae bacterium]|jgi:hypothetical protein|nr:PKD domain-containing protein [Desulfococcaceae bacterium]
MVKRKSDYAVCMFIFQLLFLLPPAYGQCPDAMTAYWKMDDEAAEVCTDAVGGNNGQCAGECPVPTPYGRVNSGRVFKTASGIRIPADNLFNWETDESFSIAYWVKKQPGTLSGDEVVIGRGDDSGENSGSLKWWSGIASGGVASFFIRENQGKEYRLNGNKNVADGYWHHITVGKDAEKKEYFLYVDLEQEGTAVYSNAGTLVSETADLRVGWLDAGDKLHFRGILDEIAIYKKRIPETDIFRHYFDGLAGIRRGYCDTLPEIRIMPLGDSVTAGVTEELPAEYMAGYRFSLFANLTNFGYEIDFTGTQRFGEVLSSSFDADNEGHLKEMPETPDDPAAETPEGWTSAEIAKHVYGWLAANPADIILLHTGTYDMTGHAGDVSDILDEIDRFSKDIPVVLALIINQNPENPLISAFNSSLYAIALERIRNGDKIIPVNMHNILTGADDMWEDGIHPSTRGYHKMADAWFSALLQNPASAPLADGGADMSATEGSTVTLDASDSFDPNGPIASYEWRQISGTPVALSGADSMRVSFAVPPVSAFDPVFRVTVSDTSGLIRTDDVNLTVLPLPPPPHAEPGTEQSVQSGDMVTLDASASFAAEGSEIISYQWVQTEGTPVNLSAPDQKIITFSAPNVEIIGETLIFLLTVTDSYGQTDAGEISVRVRNTRPVADAGEDQVVREGTIVTLDASASYDPDGGIASYLWEQKSGTAVILSDENAAQTAFVAPEVGDTGILFQLTVKDAEGQEDRDEVLVTVNAGVVNTRPVADAGEDRVVTEGAGVILDASASYDPDGGIASYLWEQKSGTAVILSDKNAAQTGFVAPKVGDTGILFQLTVKDAEGREDRDEVLVTVNANGISGFPDDVSTFMSAAGRPLGISAGHGGHLVKLNPLEASSVSDTVGRPENLIYGLTDFEIRLDAPESSAVVTFYLPEAAPEEYKWYRYGPGSGWLVCEDAVFSENRKEVTLTLWDAGSGDEGDPAAEVNGIIRNISGLGYIPPPKKEDRDELISCFIQTSGRASVLYFLQNRIRQWFGNFYRTINFDCE